MKIVITVEVPDGAAVVVGTTEETAAKPPKGKAKAAPETAPQAAPQAPAATASAPAAAAPAAEAPPLTLKELNAKVSVLAGLDRDVAAAILVAHGASKVKTSTTQLKPEVYQVVFDETEEAIDKINAAATQVANSGSLV